MKFDNVYFINGTAYAGKSTMIGLLARKYDGIECAENYHDALMAELDPEEFPNLTYTRDLKDWADFIRRTPDEYERWVDGVTKECAILEMRILREITAKSNRMVFVDTNIPPEMLYEISDTDHVLIMLAEPSVSVNRFFERPDKEKQFLYQLLLREKDPPGAMANFRECLMRINSPERNAAFMQAGFTVLKRDDTRSIEETLTLVEKAFKLI